jgi:hypothetical protein
MKTEINRLGRDKNSQPGVNGSDGLADSLAAELALAVGGGAD